MAVPLTLHDFRRSAARNLVRAGVSDTVAMRVTGHRTRSMFDRYNITADRDVAQALTDVEQLATAERRQHRPKR